MAQKTESYIGDTQFRAKVLSAAFCWLLEASTYWTMLMSLCLEAHWNSRTVNKQNLRVDPWSHSFCLINV